MATFVGGAGAKVDASGTTIGVNVGSVLAGDLVVGIVKWEGTATTIATLTDGSSGIGTGVVLDPDGVISHANTDLSAEVFYLLASVASGTVTYTATLSAARAWKQIAVGVFRYSGTAAFEDSNRSAPDVDGANVLTSPTITIAGGELVAVGFWGNYETNTPTTNAINGVTADGTFGNTDGSQGWYRLLAAGFTGAATSTGGHTIGNAATMSLIAFEITAAVASVALEWKQPTSQPTTHFVPTIVVS